MSKTHKTKPFRVKICQGLVDAYEEHDHTKGSCDLPPLTPQTVDDWTSTRCHWWGNSADPMAFCGCYACTGHFERKSNGKRNRKHAKQKTYDWKRDPELYDEELIEQKRELW